MNSTYKAFSGMSTGPINHLRKYTGSSDTDFFIGAGIGAMSVGGTRLSYKDVVSVIEYSSRG